MQHNALARCTIIWRVCLSQLLLQVLAVGCPGATQEGVDIHAPPECVQPESG